MRHAFTVDLEDWYQGIPITAETRGGAERRLAVGTDRLLEMMAAYDVRGTFYVLGPVALDHPEVIRRIAAGGHELGCHGWSHDLLYRMDRDRFRAETERAVGAIGEISGTPVTSYRAAYFSITRDSLWAFDELAALGFRCDSSVFPIVNWRYGIPDFEPAPHFVETPSGRIYEVPMTVRELFGRRIPVSGGAYFRIYPYALTRMNFRRCESENRPVVFYLHPWELDPHHPRVRFAWRPWVTHYANLASTERKLDRLFRDFEFTSMQELFADELA